MIDLHVKTPGMGLLPFIGPVSTYSLLVFAGIALGMLYYFKSVPKRDESFSQGVIIVSSALIGGFIGAKIPLLFEGHSLAELLYGKSITGGLLGGFAGVVIVKKMMGIKEKLGNYIAPAAALGVAVGRLGCLMGGCCYGIGFKYGIDLGDGILRHPTQLYESIYNFVLFLIFHRIKNKVPIPGMLFKIYILAYFIFRFLVEFIRVNPKILLGLTIYQLVSIGGVVLSTVLITVELIKFRREVRDGKQ